MRLRIWGTRGSVPAPGMETVRYGGNTSCVELVVTDDESIVLDAGTGLRRLGLRHRGRRPARVNILLTHLHFDHVQGLGFFEPLFSPATEVHLWGPGSPARSLEERLTKYLSPPLFPVRLPKIPEVYFHDVPADPFRVGTVAVEAQEIVHPGPTLGYRLQAGGLTVTYMPDHEPALGADGIEADRPEWISGFSLARDTDLLVHDGQYGDDEYPSHRGWGHSAVTHSVAFALACRARRLLLFHHDPQHSDEDCDRLLSEARRAWGRPDAVASACEETEIDVASWAAEESPAPGRALEA